MDMGATVCPTTGPNSDKSLKLSTLNSQRSSSLCHSFNVLYAICIIVLFSEMFSTPEYTCIEGKDFVSACHASHPHLQCLVCALKTLDLSRRFRIMSTPTIWGQSKDMAIFETKINKASEMNEIRLPICRNLFRKK